MNIRGAIFDVDGTLLDSMPIWDTVGEDYVRAQGLEPQAGLREILQDMSLYQAACYLRKEYDIDLPPEKIIAGIDARIELFYREEVSLKPGAAELLEQLCQAGVKLCIATATSRPLIEAALSRLGVLPCFSRIFTCAEVGHGKDEPHIFEEALRFLDTERTETWVFEDALYAVRTAKGAGFPVAAVYDGHERKEEEIHALADLYLKNLSQFNLVWKSSPA